jgi:uncharacterized protein (DUF305 family)
VADTIVTEERAGAAAVGSARLRIVLAAVVALALVVGAVVGAAVWGTSSSSSSPSATSVDVGFVQDMSAHHIQAITMASYTRDYTSNPDIKLLAYDIEDEQKFQVGEMQGWLDIWGQARVDPTPMAWMAGHDHVLANGLMPGMATADQLTQLKTLHGTALDILFLQLMIHHHQGGLPMAQYAAQHATQGYVRDLAQAMVTAQSSEIVTMEQQLRQLGGTPLPAPPTH